MVARAGRGLFVNPICPQTQVAHIYCYIFISVGARNFVMVLSTSIDRMLVSFLYIDPSRARHLFLVTVFKASFPVVQGRFGCVVIRQASLETFG